ncbi:MAG: DUF4132 domain-containing protein [Pseudomonadota bacterium]
MFDFLKRLGKTPPADKPAVPVGQSSVGDFVAEYVQAMGSNSQLTASRLESGQRILSSKPAQRVRYVLDCLQLIDEQFPEFKQLVSRRMHTYRDPIAYRRHALLELLRALLRKKTPFDRAQVLALLDWLSVELHRGKIYSFYDLPLAPTRKALVDYVAGGGDVDGFEPVVAKIAKRLSKAHEKSHRKYGAEMLKAIGASKASLPLKPGEAWSDAAIGYHSSLTGDACESLSRLIEHCATADGGKPTKKWTKAAESLLEQLDREALVERTSEWFLLADKPRTEPITSWSRWAPDPNPMLDPENADVLKGLVWVCGIIGESASADGLGKLAMSTYRKLPGVGPRAPKVGNATVWALGQIPGDHALAALAILKVRTRYKPAQKGIAAALAAAAQRAGMTPEELEEIGVPDYGMGEVGLRTESFGDYTAELQVLSASKVELGWIKQDGKRIKSVPKAVREDYPDELKDLRQASKDIVKMLSAQKERIDTLHLQQRHWRYEDFVSRYLDHPLVGTLGRRLIWNFNVDGIDVSGIWHNGQIIRHDDQNLETLAADTDVTLWHPVTATSDDVVAWRDWLERHEIVQPFKQAHREIYVLTAAEENTSVYSNRFASHIVKQHQFNALCATRGWQNSLRMMVDEDYAPPTLDLPQWGLRAEFWVEGMGDDYGTDTTEAGSFLYLATDQVRFYRTQAARNSAHAGGGGYVTYGADNEISQPLPLADIDPLVFSEVLRDVDLFVGVASVGNDPNWSDGGPEGRFYDYWNSYSFGDLGESAKTRRDALQRLIPRLKIRDRLSIIDGRFLRVQGDIRAYKIHLGSSNILMEPNDQYLCIVPAQGTARKSDEVFLPFEGDNRLALILSKAFLLADDKRIKDRTILSQIQF